MPSWVGPRSTPRLCRPPQVNAARVADYIASQQQQEAGDGQGSAAQFLVVSHRPQVYERAGCLVGVYSCGRASHAVTVHVAADEA